MADCLCRDEKQSIQSCRKELTPVMLSSTMDCCSLCVFTCVHQEQPPAAAAAPGWQSECPNNWHPAALSPAALWEGFTCNIPPLNTRTLKSRVCVSRLLLCLLPCSKFYDRLKELREYHKRFPVYDISAAEDDSGLLKDEPRVEFSGEEGMGRWVREVVGVNTVLTCLRCIFFWVLIAVY